MLVSIDYYITSLSEPDLFIEPDLFQTKTDNCFFLELWKVITWHLNFAVILWALCEQTPGVTMLGANVNVGQGFFFEFFGTLFLGTVNYNFFKCKFQI